EKRMAWGEFFQGVWARTGIMPLALCHESRELTLEDMLDEGSALDQFILELFTASGQQTQIGKQGPNILINPPPGQKLDMYDGVLFLKPIQEDL
ncbi:MAG: two pore domain potassium channel family protein, partial [Thermodesulfobacteriota bacterium]|nr:two pore domain potassium channel family protein [Thermodesulfobacteriota bacterium]